MVGVGLSFTQSDRTVVFSRDKDVEFHGNLNGMSGLFNHCCPGEFVPERRFDRLSRFPSCLRILSVYGTVEKLNGEVRHRQVNKQIKSENKCHVQPTLQTRKLRWRLLFCSRSFREGKELFEPSKRVHMSFQRHSRAS